MKHMVSLTEMRSAMANIVCIGSHHGIVQSILDFDYASGKTKPSVIAIIASGRKSERYFFGNREVLIPVKSTCRALAVTDQQKANYCINLTSGRRVLASIQEALEYLPNLMLGTVFAEGMPEKHALEVTALANKYKVRIIGAASVGIIIPRVIKLGAIGGIETVQLEQSQLFSSGGQCAVISTSGGMVNEIIRTVAYSGYGLSFAIALGGERFPVTSPDEAFLLAEQDPETATIVYFGELGGDDEYRIAELIKAKQVTKPVISYVAGSVAELFAEAPQFGHAKAMAKTKVESATAKSAALASVGVTATTVYGDFIAAVNHQPELKKRQPDEKSVPLTGVRRPRLFASTISQDKDDDVQILGMNLLEYTSSHTFGYIVASLFLGKPVISKELESFVDFVIRLLVDHGPYVSGVVNTMVSARAGKDLVSSLASGLLTIGPRFGGAINGAAAIWLEGLEGDMTAAGLVESYARRKQYLPGIGHRKYSIDRPDPRVQAILAFSNKKAQFVTFALGVQSETAQKKGNLILNVDGAIAAVLLDILYAHEGYSFDQLRDLIDVEFFNGLFVLARSVGFMAHYFDQRRLDEGLFRLGHDDILSVD